MQKTDQLLQTARLAALSGRFPHNPKKANRLHAGSMSFFYTFVVRFTGELSEWLKEPASKTGVRQRTGGSNPSLSALSVCFAGAFRVSEGSFYAHFYAQNLKEGVINLIFEV